MRIRFTERWVREGALQRVLEIVSVACCLLVVGGTAAEARESPARDVSGDWVLELVLPDGDVFTGTLSLQQEAGQITGTWKREGDSEESRVTGEIKGGVIAFSWILNIPARGGGNDGAVRMSFEGEVDGDTMRGTASLGRRADDLDWTAERID